jgi:methylisocitrate lyase
MREAGADILFVEAPATRDELREVARALPGVPLVANMVEGGKTPMVPARELEEMGYAIVLYPNALLRVFARHGADVLERLRVQGTTEGAEMVRFDQLNEIVGLAEVMDLERRYVEE